MSQDITYLMDEICAGVEVYYSGRTGGQYLKTAFILCDNYSELISKLFLLTDNPRWTDKRTKGNFKQYPEIMDDVENRVSRNTASQIARVKELQDAMKQRHKRRNDFFHKTSLLDLSLTQRNCIEAFCDLFEYGEILFGNDWRTAITNTRNLATLEIMLQLEKRALTEPSITTKVNKIFQDWPRNTHNNKKKGVHIAVYPEDLHLRLCVTCGGKNLHDTLKALLFQK